MVVGSRLHNIIFVICPQNALYHSISFYIELEYCCPYMKRSTNRVTHILPVIIPNADTAASESCADTGTDAKYTSKTIPELQRGMPDTCAGTGTDAISTTCSKTIPGLQKGMSDTTAASENCAFTGRLHDI